MRMPLRRYAAAGAAACALITLPYQRAWSQAAADAPIAPTTSTPTPPPPTSPASAPASAPDWLARWTDPARAPFIPIPEIITDPDSGTTVGLLPTWLITNDQREIVRIIAPDVQYNSFFGWGAHARILDYPSADVQWSAVAGASERVQRKIDLEFLKGRLRRNLFSYSASLVYVPRDAAPEELVGSGAAAAIQ